MICKINCWYSFEVSEFNCNGFGFINKTWLGHLLREWTKFTEQRGRAGRQRGKDFFTLQLQRGKDFFTLNLQRGKDFFTLHQQRGKYFFTLHLQRGKDFLYCTFNPAKDFLRFSHFAYGNSWKSQNWSYCIQIFNMKTWKWHENVKLSYRGKFFLLFKNIISFSKAGL